MSMTDPISDLLTRIRNAHLSKHDRLDVPSSKLKLEVARLLKEEGFIKNLRQIEPAEGEPVGVIRIFLRYSAEGTPAINHLARISRPGRRVYRRAGGDVVRARVASGRDEPCRGLERCRSLSPRGRGSS